MKHALKLMLLAFGLTASLSVADAEGTLQGTWNTSFGEVEIFEEYDGQGKANRFYGTYADKGFVYGHNNGTTAHGIFVYANQTTGQRTDAAKFGTFYWNQNQPGDKFTGQWSWGKVAPTGGAWQGTRVSSDTPSFDTGKLRRWSASYVIEAGPQLNSWMQSVKNLPNAGFAKPAIKMPSSSATRQQALVPTHQQSAPDPQPAAAQRGPQDEALDRYRRDFDLSQFNEASCYVPSDMLDWMTCKPKGSGQVNDRWYMPVAYCSPGTLEPVTFSGVAQQAKCKAQTSGSFANSCEPMEMFSNEWGVKAPELRTFCDGPKIRTAGFDKDIASTKSTKIVYVGFGAPNGRQYLNLLDWDWCPSMKFWNSGGHIQCVR